MFSTHGECLATASLPVSKYCGIEPSNKLLNQILDLGLVYGLSIGAGTEDYGKMEDPLVAIGRLQLDAVPFYDPTDPFAPVSSAGLHPYCHTAK